ncbi:hypothetical protein T01_8249 [Trichinella spiralis]|uniref:Uncharacterized protein n=1 Tax=Trichinella spiralis TaxID=6334 RepID=A0A0V1B5S5_TRISP|nr:hypothetical protein T01_8249 [Trichinella spiralis]
MFERSILPTMPVAMLQSLLPLRMDCGRCKAAFQICQYHSEILKLKIFYTGVIVDAPVQASTGKHLEQSDKQKQCSEHL